MISFDGPVGRRTVISGTITDFPLYSGNFNVTPKLNEETILKTKGRKMRVNVVVREIPVREISNLQGGETILIGDDRYGG